MDKAFERVVKPKPAAVLRALIWPMGILMTVTLGLVFAKAPTWLLVVFSTMAVISALLYFSSYIFCLLKDRDALRSETYSLKRLGPDLNAHMNDRPSVSNTTAWSFNDDPRPPYEPGIMDMQDDIMTHLYADIEWLEKEVLHMKLVMTAARGEIEDQDYDAASAMMRYAIERPL